MVILVVKLRSLVLAIAYMETISAEPEQFQLIQ